MLIITYISDQNISYYVIKHEELEQKGHLHDSMKDCFTWIVEHTETSGVLHY